jgi:hypothetical protein
MLAIETKGDVRNHMTISSDDGRIHAGQALFDLFRSPRLLDAVETFIGSEIYFSPVGHTRDKPPERLLPEEVLKNAAVGSAFWHQDLGVTREWMNEGKMLKVWSGWQSTDRRYPTAGTPKTPCARSTPAGRHADLPQRVVLPSARS